MRTHARTISEVEFFACTLAFFLFLVLFLFFVSSADYDNNNNNNNNWYYLRMGSSLHSRKKSRPSSTTERIHGLCSYLSLIHI